VTRPRTLFRAYVRVRFHECDPLGHVNNAVYLGYLEQVAIDHAAAAGWPASRLRKEAGAVFVARRHEIDFLRPAFENDVLEIITWPDGMSAARAFRYYEVRKVDLDPLRLPSDELLPGESPRPDSRHNLLITARTEWAFANVELGRPVRIPESVTRDFLEEEE
jgi:acyl-CoA thioester hydrolase